MPRRRNAAPLASYGSRRLAWRSPEDSSEVATSPAHPIETAETRLEVVTPPYPAAVQTNTLAVSPDGRKLVFVSIVDGQTRLWLRPLDSAAARVLAGTEGASVPFWSPDSQSVAFFADGKLKRMDLAGGLPQTLANVQAGDRRHLEQRGRDHLRRSGFCRSGARALDRLHRVSASGGGKPVPVPTPDIRAVALRHPQFLPDGRRFLFEATSGDLRPSTSPRSTRRRSGR